ncbi:hypothetical protein AHAS_Ahas09G0176700 [Arachis hypogaea]
MKDGEDRSRVRVRRGVVVRTTASIAANLPLPLLGFIMGSIAVAVMPWCHQWKPPLSLEKNPMRERELVERNAKQEPSCRAVDLSPCC